MKKIYLVPLIMLAVLASCGNLKNNNVEEAKNSENKESKEVKEQENKETTKTKENSDEENEASKIQDNVVHGKLTLTDQKEQGAYYDKTSNTKYILGENNTIKKIVNKSNQDVPPDKFMQKDAEKVNEYSSSVCLYYSESIDKYYKVIKKGQSQNNVLIVTINN